MFVVKDLFQGLLPRLVPESTLVPNADTVQKELNVIFDNLPINLHRQHQARENILGQSKSLPRLEYLLQLAVLLLRLLKLLSFLVTDRLQESNKFILLDLSCLLVSFLSLLLPPFLLLQNLHAALDLPQLERRDGFSKVRLLEIWANGLSESEPLLRVSVLPLGHEGNSDIEATSVVPTVLAQALEVKVKGLVSLVLEAVGTLGCHVFLLGALRVRTWEGCRLGLNG